MTSQFMVLNKILNTKDFSLISLNNLTEDYFFDYKAEFNFIKNHYNTYKLVPDKLTFANTFPNFDFIDVTEPDTYLINQLIEDYNAAFLATKFNVIKKMLEAGETNQAMEYFKKAAENMRKGSALTCTDLTKDTSRYDRYVDRISGTRLSYINTGFAELDKLIGGIDVENENMVIAARTGIGKSWTLLIMAAAAARQGLTVGIYSGEMSVDKVGYRIDTLLGHINNTAITRGYADAISAYKDYISKLPESRLGSIKVITPNDIAGPATVDALRAFVEKEKLNILFVDQYSLLEDTSHAKDGWARVANISKAIKNLQVMARIPIISVSQMNRTKNDDGSQDTTQIGLSDRIGQDATVVLMLDKKEEEQEGKKIYNLTINIVKSRDGGDGAKLSYHADFNNGTFIFIPEKGSTIVSEEEAQRIQDSYSQDYDGSGDQVF